MRPGRPDPDPAANPADPAVALLQLALRIRQAGGDPHALNEALRACRDWFVCDGGFADALGRFPADHHQLSATAECVAACAEQGFGGCGGLPGDPRKRERCAALASHLRDAASAVRQALRVAVFDAHAPTWIVDRAGRLLDANADALALTAAADPQLAGLAVVEGVVLIRDSTSAPRLAKAISETGGETRFAWCAPDGQEGALRVRLLEGGQCVRLTLVADVPAAGLVAGLKSALGLTPRQGELAALLVTGHSLASAARNMGIGVETAKGHLEKLHRHTCTADRVALILALRKASAPG